jgi:ketosteroid isomerase-like protein
MSTAQASPQTSAIEEGTAQPAPMRLSNVEIVRLEYAAMRRRDLDEVLERLDPDIEWCEPAGVLPPPAGGGIRHGRRAVEKGVFETVPDYWSEFRVEPELFLDAGERVVVTGRFYCKAKETGREVSVPCVQIWTLRAGKAVRMENHTHTAELARALVQQPVKAA